MGKVIMSGIVPPLVKPKIPGIQASELAVGSSVYLMENGVATEYLVVNQGKPSGSSLYDDSCDGMWILRKNILGFHEWHSSDVNDYANSTIHAYLNSDVFNVFGKVEQTAIMQVKIPYVNGTGGSAIASGENGLFTKIFILGGYELGWTTSDYPYFPIDGAKLSYFESGTGESAKNKRIATINGNNQHWWTRSARTDITNSVMRVVSNGTCSAGVCSNEYIGVRPTMILPYTSVFDETTMLLKGVA